MAGIKKSLGTTPPWAIMLFGATLCGMAVFIQFMSEVPVYKALAATLAAMGAGTLGAGIGATVASSDGRDTLAHIRDLLTDAVQARMHSNEDELSVVKRRWYFYHLTQSDGRYVWRHTDYRLDVSSAPGTIATVVRDNAFGRTHVFRSEVAARGDRVILIEEDIDGRVPGLVAITPDFNLGFRKVRAGIALVHTWDGTSILSKCLWSVEALTAAPPVKGQLSKEDGLAMERLWKQTFTTSNVLLPSVSDVIDGA